MDIERSHDSKANIDGPTFSHESHQHANFKTGKNSDGDTAMALFDDPDELHEEVDPAEARKLLWKIDFMILPYLAVCYAFFYIDKVCSVVSSQFSVVANIGSGIDRQP